MDEVKIDLDILKYPVTDVLDLEQATGLRLMSELAAAENGNGTATVSARLLLGLAWITYRRTHPGFTWQEAQTAWTYGELLDSIEGEDSAPLATNRAQRRASAKPRRRSASSTAGHQKSSVD